MFVEYFRRRDLAYISVTLIFYKNYGYFIKLEYNLTMANVVAETFSWYHSVPLINNIFVLWIMSSIYLLIIQQQRRYKRKETLKKFPIIFSLRIATLYLLIHRYFYLTGDWAVLLNFTITSSQNCQNRLSASSCLSASIEDPKSPSIHFHSDLYGRIFFQNLSRKCKLF